MTERFAGLDDNAVIEAYLKGDEQAFGEIDRRYRPRLLNILYRALRDREKAEDLVQETFFKIHKFLPNFDPKRSRFSHWLYVVAFNLAKTEFRNRKRLRIVFYQYFREKRDEEKRLLQFRDPGALPDELYEKRSKREFIIQVTQVLPKHLQHTFLLRELGNLSCKQVATIMNTKEGTVRSRHFRARHAFFKHLKSMTA